MADLRMMLMMLVGMGANATAQNPTLQNGSVQNGMAQTVQISTAQISTAQISKVRRPMVWTDGADTDVGGPG
jgi:hypothetical protein